MGNTKIGNPSSFQESLAEEISNRIAGGEWIMRVCQDQSMPCLRAVCRWLNHDPAFHRNYQMAKELCEDHYLTQILEIARDTNLPICERRIRIDALKWVTERMTMIKKAHRPKIKTA